MLCRTLLRCGISSARVKKRRLQALDSSDSSGSDGEETRLPDKWGTQHPPNAEGFHIAINYASSDFHDKSETTGTTEVMAFACEDLAAALEDGPLHPRFHQVCSVASKQNHRIAGHAFVLACDKSRSRECPPAFAKAIGERWSGFDGNLHGDHGRRPAML